MGSFKLQSDFSPRGDQDQAIESLLKGINGGDRFQTLLGVTGSGKNVYNRQCNRKGKYAHAGFIA